MKNRTVLKHSPAFSYASYLSITTIRVLTLVGRSPALKASSGSGSFQPTAWPSHA
jgi:hypothetical protein